MRSQPNGYGGRRPLMNSLDGFRKIRADSNGSVTFGGLPNLFFRVFHCKNKPRTGKLPLRR